MANELLEKLVTAKENAASLQRDMLIYVKQEKLWDKLIEVQRHNYISNFMNLAMQQEQFDSDKELVEGTLSSKDITDMCATPQTGCQHYCYENEKLAWLVN